MAWNQEVSPPRKIKRKCNKHRNLVPEAGRMRELLNDKLHVETILSSQQKTGFGVFLWGFLSLGAGGEEGLFFVFFRNPPS